MGIDGIGKPPSIPPGAGAPAGGADGTGASFRVDNAESSAAPSGDLVRLERGEIELDAYLETRVGEATRHLEGRLTAPQLEFVKQTLRAELESDPVLIELVRRATGKTPGSAEL